ncbi:hypothetical protein TYRP_009860 [Tyrophagus putrescentiae]|nr:hypothetical protein TYRP_009860 [Tyrophagus putrescentiae]
MRAITAFAQSSASGVHDQPTLKMKCLLSKTSLPRFHCGESAATMDIDSEKITTEKAPPLLLSPLLIAGNCSIFSATRQVKWPVREQFLPQSESTPNPPQLKSPHTLSSLSRCTKKRPDLLLRASSERQLKRPFKNNTFLQQQSTSFAFLCCSSRSKVAERSPKPRLFSKGDIIAFKYKVDRFLRGAVCFVFKCHTENEDKEESGFTFHKEKNLYRLAEVYSPMTIKENEIPSSIVKSVLLISSKEHGTNLHGLNGLNNVPGCNAYHCDLNPDNILVKFSKNEDNDNEPFSFGGQTGSIKIADFDSVKESQRRIFPVTDQRTKCLPRVSTAGGNAWPALLQNSGRLEGGRHITAQMGLQPAGSALRRGQLTRSPPLNDEMIGLVRKKRLERHDLAYVRNKNYQERYFFKLCSKFDCSFSRRKNLILRLVL